MILTDLDDRIPVTDHVDSRWGGLVVYPQTHVEDHFKALVNFANNIPQNPKGAAIVMPVYQSTVGANLILNAYDYAEPVARPAAYDEFFAIPNNVSDTTGLRDMSSLAEELAGHNTHRQVKFEAIWYQKLIIPGQSLLRNTYILQ